MLRSKASPMLVLIMLVVIGPFAAAQSDDDIAMQFYPKALDDAFVKTHAPDKPVVRFVTTLRVDLDGSGQFNYIAAAFSNGLASTLRIINTAGPTPTVVAESNDPTMGGGGKPVVAAADIDNDGIPEIILEFHRATWIYQYKNSRLALFGPTTQGPVGPTSNLGSVALVDIDGDGKLEILEFAAPGSDPPYIVWQLGENGMFIHSSSNVVFSEWFRRADGAPVVQERLFKATAGTGYTLRVINGDQRKNSTVDAAEIRLNGVTVFRPKNFKPKQRTLSVPVHLLAQNDLTVELRSDPESILTVIIVRGE